VASPFIFMQAFINIPPRRIPRVVVGLTFFWGIIIWAFNIGSPIYNLYFLLTWATAIIIGFWSAEIHSDRFHTEILEDLHYQFDKGLDKTDRAAFYSEERGVYSMLGPVPFHRNPLAQLKTSNEAAIQLARQHCPVEFGENKLDFVENYIEAHAQTHPGHVALFMALLKVYLHPDQITYPAGFNGMHGGRSLITHSLLVSGLCARKATDFSYELPYGLQAIDANYKLNPSDPLIPIIGLAHDIGKFSCLVFDEEGQACDIAPNHDTEGARQLAMLDAYWDERICAEDRRILQMILAFYHHPSELPVDVLPGRKKQARVTSDRLHALLELLIHCDIFAGQLENGKTYKEAQATASSPMAKVDSGNAEALLNSFFSHVAIKASINSRGNKIRSTAFKYQDAEKTGSRVYLYFDESVWREEFMSYINAEDSSEGVGQNQIHPITGAVLSELHKIGYLVDFSAGKGGLGKSSSIRNLLYSVEFQDPDTKEVSIRFKTCFVLDITDVEVLKDIASRSNCHSSPVNVKPRFGQRGMTRSATDVIAQSELLGKAPEHIGVAAEAVELKPSAKLLKNTKMELRFFFADPKTDKIEAEISSKIEIIGPLDFEGRKVWLLKGLDSYFEDRGFHVPTLAQDAKLYGELGFLHVKPSTKIEGTFVWLVSVEKIKVQVA